MQQRYASLLFIPLFLNGCISVNVPMHGIQKSERVAFSKPSFRFKDIEVPQTDKAWRNSQNGNTISYLSQCQDNSDPSLSAIKAEMISGLDDAETVNEQLMDYNERKALDLVVIGKIDGVKTLAHLRILKKNNCIYSLSYIAKEKSFEEDHSVFQEFLKNWTVR